MRRPWWGCEWVAVGCWGEEVGEGGAPKARGIGVKEMLTDTINVICLLPHEVDSRLHCTFVPSIFSPPDPYGLRARKTLRNCMEKGRRAKIPKSTQFLAF